MNIKDMNITELEQHINNNLNNLSIKELFQFFNYETIGKINILDSNSDEYKYIKLILQSIENKLAETSGRVPAVINISTEENSTGYVYATNTTDVEILDKCDSIRYPQLIIHENTHPNEMLALKHQVFDNKKYNNILNNVKNDLNKNFPLIGLQRGVEIPKQSYNQDVLKQLLISNAVDVYTKTMMYNLAKKYSKTNDALTMETHLLYGYYEYMSAVELEARIIELSAMPEEFNIIMNESDFNIKLRQLEALQNNLKIRIERILKKQSILPEYLKYCKQVLKENKLPEYKIFNMKETEKYINSRLDCILTNCRNIANTIEEYIDIIDLKVKEYTELKEFYDLNNALNIIADQQYTPYELLRYNNEKFLTACDTINNQFNIDVLKYRMFQNKNVENNIQYVANRLYNIYKEIKSAVYENDKQDEIASKIENIFLKIFANEKNIYLLDANIDIDIIKIIETESVFSENLNINSKLEEYKYMYNAKNNNIKINEINKTNINIDDLSV